MIRHSVIFTLKYAKGSAEEKDFLQATEKLADIPGVKAFEQLEQVSKKNTFDYGLSMEFANQDEYDIYNNHPDHTAFIRQYWIPGVEDFLEIDYTPLNK
ncbi:MAG: Dabb family protein [Chitinophagaceae bacterium]|nr:Dabb family protein [Chitinophagaceae bacterium]